MKTLKFLMAVVVGLMLLGCNDDNVGGEGKESLFIPFACNGYVTPTNPDSKQTPEFANDIVQNFGANFVDDGEMLPGQWATRGGDPCQLSVYFYTAYTGTIDLDLVVSKAYADATIGVEIGGTKHEVFIGKSDDEQICNAGKYKISKPGYVRINLTQIEVGTTPPNDYLAPYPDIWGFQVRGSGIGNVTKRCEQVMFATPEDNKHHPANPDLSPYWIRRAPYIVFWWDRCENVEYFYNEVYVAHGDDVKGAYYQITGGDDFYMGIQPYTDALGLNGRVVLFSVWDTDTAAGDVAELVNKGEGVVTNNYDNEGSGIQCFLPYDWKTGRTYATMVRVRPEVVDGAPTGHSLYTGYFRGDEGWVFLAEVRRPKIQTYLESPYSFNENFMPEQGWIPRTVSFPSQWMRDKDGVWYEIVGGTFKNSWGVNQVRYDYKAGVNEQGAFYLTTAGYFSDGRTPENSRFTRQPSGVAPDIDLEALEQMAKNK